MNNKSENSETPENNKPRLRRLGLRRIGTKTPLHCSTNVLLKQNENRETKTTSVITPASVTQSDLRVNYRCLESEKRRQRKQLLECATPLTSTVSATAKSTNGRQTRYGLRPRVREQLTKKRLQFQVEQEEPPQKQKVKHKESPQDQTVNETETPTTSQNITALKRDEPIASQEQTVQQEESPQEQTANETEASTSTQNITALRQDAPIASQERTVNGIEEYVTQEEINASLRWEEPDSDEERREELIASINLTQSELEAQRRFEKKVRDIRRSVQMWHDGFLQTINDLQLGMDLQPSYPEILTRLNIPQRMIKYIRDPVPPNDK